MHSGGRGATMKEGLRQSMAWLHTWTGLVTGWVLFFVFATGSAGYFNYEIDRWMRPELPRVSAMQASDTATALGRAQAYLQARYSNAEFWNIGLPVERTQPYFTLFVRAPRNADGSPGRAHRATYDPASGEFVEQTPARDTGGGQLLYRMHYLLHYLPGDAGILAVGICTMFMLVALISGVVTHKKILTDFYTFRPGKGQRSWLDAHNLSSVLALPFFLMITYSGLAFFLPEYMPAGIMAGYGTGPSAQRDFQAEAYPASHIPASGRQAPLASLSQIARQAGTHWHGIAVSGLLVRHPGDAAARVIVRAQREGRRAIGVDNLQFDGVTGQPMPAGSPGAPRQFASTLYSLHEGRFAAPALRWLYFLSGLLGCAMIATGLVLWTAKRKARQGGEFGYRLVHGLNIGTIAGLPIAIVSYFWANRLIPAGLPGRAAWEAHVMFIVWAAMLAYPALRPPTRAWIETLRLAALAYALLPLVNALTTERHLGTSLPAGDWVLAGFDLSMLGLGLLFAHIAHTGWRKPGGFPCQDDDRPAPSLLRYVEGKRGGIPDLIVVLAVQCHLAIDLDRGIQHVPGRKQAGKFRRHQGHGAVRRGTQRTPPSGRGLDTDHGSCHRLALPDQAKAGPVGLGRHQLQVIDRLGLRAAGLGGKDRQHIVAVQRFRREAHVPRHFWPRQGYGITIAGGLNGQFLAVGQHGARLFQDRHGHFPARRDQFADMDLPAVLPDRNPDIGRCPGRRRCEADREAQSRPEDANRRVHKSLLIGWLSGGGTQLPAPPARITLSRRMGRDSRRVRVNGPLVGRWRRLKNENNFHLLWSNRPHPTTTNKPDGCLDRQPVQNSRALLPARKRTYLLKAATSCLFGRVLQYNTNNLGPIRIRRGSRNNSGHAEHQFAR